MSQLISIGTTISDTIDNTENNLNFAGVVNLLESLGDRYSKYSLLTKIDPYGNTKISKSELPQFIQELELLVQEPEANNFVKNIMEFRKGPFEETVPESTKYKGEIIKIIDYLKTTLLTRDSVTFIGD